MVSKEDIPDHWGIQSIGEISKEIRTGGTPSKDNDSYWEGDIPWISSKCIDEGDLKVNGDAGKITEEGLEEGSRLATEDTVLIVTRVGLGKVAVADRKMAFNQDIKKIDLPSKIDPFYFARFISHKVDEIKSKGRGSTVKGITTSDLKEIAIPVPPLDEQEMIVEKLDSIFENIKEIQDAQERVEGIEDKFTQSLIRSLIGNKTKNEEWEWKELEDISERLRSTTDPSNNPMEKFEYYSMPFFDKYKKPRTIKGNEIKSRKRTLNGGEIMISRLNPRKKRIWKVNQNNKNKIASTEFVALKLYNTEINRDFLYYYLHSEKVTNFLKNKVTASTKSRKRVPYSEVMKLKVPVPPLEEQKMIVEKLDSILEEFEEINSIKETGREIVNILSKSVLNEAFKGNLVNQNE